MTINKIGSKVKHLRTNFRVFRNQSVFSVVFRVENTSLLDGWQVYDRDTFMICQSTVAHGVYY